MDFPHSGIERTTEVFDTSLRTIFFRLYFLMPVSHLQGPAESFGPLDSPLSIPYFLLPLLRAYGPVSYGVGPVIAEYLVLLLLAGCKSLLAVFFSFPVCFLR